MRIIFAAAGIILTELFIVGASSAATIIVPDDVPSVLAAVDEATPGDTVLVRPGTWTDRDTRIINIGGVPTAITACAFPKGRVSMLGESGAEATTLDIGETTQGQASVLMIANQTGVGDIHVEGFTLTGARGSIAAHAVVAIQADKVTLQSCRIANNGSSPTEGNTVQGRSFSLEMVNCDVSDNIGELVVFVVDSEARFVQCRFANNLAKCIQAHQELTGHPVFVEHCEFTNNRATGFGSCLDLLYSSNVQVRSNLFLRNIADTFSGAGVRVAECSAIVEFNVFAYDSSIGGGTAGAIRYDGSYGVVRNNTFVGCHGTGPGSTFLARDGSSVAFEKNVVTYSSGGAAVHDNNMDVISNPCNLYWSNFGGDFGNWTVSPTEIFADPMFCDLEHLDLTIREDSPAIVGECGQIGALGIGCEDISVDELSWGRIKGLYRLGGK
jgi:hypothetical protein